MPCFIDDYLACLVHHDVSQVKYIFPNGAEAFDRHSKLGVGFRSPEGLCLSVEYLHNI